jgi:phosphonopyruvate decarboxylase
VNQNADTAIFTPAEIVNELMRLRISHVIWIPDSDLGRWEHALESADGLRLLRVCREGEAWPLAAGLLLAGKSPLIVLQTTGLFESGDALRNVVHDLGLPVLAIIGARSWRNPSSQDSARHFTEPMLRSWQVDYVLIESRSQQGRLAQHFKLCRSAGKAGFVLLAE